MARRRLHVPDAEVVARMATGLAQSPPSPASGVAPPIAVVAQQASALVAKDTAAARLQAAVSDPDATRWRQAQDEGRIILMLPLDAVDPDHLRRDRIRTDDAQMAELRASIRTNGLRTPIDVIRLAGDDRGERFGLVSGWRRLRALQALHHEDRDPRFATVPARVLSQPSLAEAYAAMVDENEIRADLSHYERGRIAVVAAEDSVYADVDEAVSMLFAAGSKAKRSKIRSFALVHEMLGDVLQHGCELSERAGLRIAAAIRSGAAGALRLALDGDRRRDAAAEWRALEPVLAMAESRPRTRSRGGRPSGSRPTAVTLENGAAIMVTKGRGCLTLRITGIAVDDALSQRLVAETVLLLNRD